MKRDGDSCLLGLGGPDNEAKASPGEGPPVDRVFASARPLRIEFWLCLAPPRPIRR